MEQKKTARYREIYEHLRKAIARGQYPVGKRIPTEVELQKSFNASRITITRALRDLEQEGFLIRRRGAGSFVRDQQARTGHLLGLLIGGDPSGIFAPIYTTMVRVAEVSRFQVAMSSLDRQDEEVIRCAEALCGQYIDRQVAGMVFAPLELPPEKMWINQRIAEVFDRAGIPLILLDRDIYDYPRRSKFDLVGIGNRRCAETLTTHLLRQGYRRIHFIGLTCTVSTVTARLAGYEDALLDAGITPNPGWFHRLNLADLDGLRELLERWQPEAFVCVNDNIAATFMQRLSMIGLHVPEDVAVVGFDDVDYANLVAVPLTTMRQPCARIGEAAIRLLLERISNSGLATREVSFDCELVVRESCGAKVRMQAAGKAVSATI